MFHHRLRMESDSPGGAAEPARFCLDLLRFPFASPGSQHPWRIAFQLGLAQLATTAGYFFEWISRWRSPSRPRPSA